MDRMLREAWSGYSTCHSTCGNIFIEKSDLKWFSCISYIFKEKNRNRITQGLSSVSAGIALCCLPY